MSPRAISFLLLILIPATGLSQTPPSDPEALALLTQAVNASGVANPLHPVRDFTATGTITYFWAGQEVSGPVTVKARASGEFRLDAQLPEGTRSWVATPRGGVLKEADGRTAEIPLHNTINLGTVTFPYPSIAAALSDPLTTVAYGGLVNLGGRQAHQVRVRRNFSPEADPDGTVSRLCTTEYFVDAQTYLLVKTLDMTHPNETLTEDLTHEIEFENYVPVDGVMVPMLVRERTIGQTIWELRISGVAFNTGLTDFDFAL